MKKLCLALVCVLVAPMLLISVSSSATYDPWADLDESGDIDIFDVVTLAGSYQTTGDPTKNVNVTNWPVTTQHTVFYALTGYGASALYNAGGFGHVHVTWEVGNLGAAESVTIDILGFIYDFEGARPRSVAAGSITVTATGPFGALSFPVPSERFQFVCHFAEGTTATVYFAFYLTYA
jgi:hypothetical protein